MSMFEKSIADFQCCLSQDAGNAAARNQLNLTLKLRHDQVQAEKNMYSNMFRNLSKETEQVNYAYLYYHYITHVTYIFLYTLPIFACTLLTVKNSFRIKECCILMGYSLVFRK